MHSLDIIIVNWNSENYLENCIESILNSNISLININIIVVDNASSDGSERFCLNNKKVKLLKQHKNLGFGRACNLASTFCNSDFILFLNPDTKVKSETLINSLIYLEENKNITVLGCRQINFKNQTLRTCARFLTPKRYFNKITGLSSLIPSIFKNYHMTDWDHENSQFVDHVMGSFYLIRKKDFDAIGKFDERYFMYYEDLDLSKRIIDKGGKIFFNSAICIFHASGGTSINVKAKRLFYSLKHTLLFSEKHLSYTQNFIMKFLILICEPIFRVIYAIGKLNLEELKNTLHAYKYLIAKNNTH
jgi:N-acetylglucosaminyl-diphospho-decaprenol L-rhamnosyltransferase